MTLLYEKLNKSQGFQYQLSLQQKMLILSKENLSEIIDLIESYLSIRKTKSSLLSIFSLISYINDCRPENIELSFAILSHYLTELKDFFTKEQIFQIFTNRKYQLFLFKNNVLDINDISKHCGNNQQIISFFTKPENDENQMNLIIKQNNVSKFQDLISKSNIPLNSRISFSFNDSIKLSNNSKLPTLLEYSVAYSATDIVKFILMNENENEDESKKAELYKDIGRYAIFGGNPEIIHLLEQNHLISNISSQKMFFMLDSISYHRNSIVDYIIENYDAQFTFDYFSNCLHSCNFQCFFDHLANPKIFNGINQLNIYKQSLLIFASQYGIYEIVECLLSFEDLNINNQDIYVFACLFNKVMIYMFCIKLLFIILLKMISKILFLF